jgi:hypothetical protein
MASQQAVNLCRKRQSRFDSGHPPVSAQGEFENLGYSSTLYYLTRIGWVGAR